MCERPSAGRSRERWRDVEAGRKTQQPGFEPSVQAETVSSGFRGRRGSTRTAGQTQRGLESGFVRFSLFAGTLAASCRLKPETVPIVTALRHFPCDSQHFPKERPCSLILSRADSG